MRLGDILAIIVGIGLFASFWWWGAHQHAIVNSNSRSALHVSKPIARFFGSRRADNIVSVNGVGMHLMAYQLTIVVLLFDFTSVPMDTLHAFLGITAYLMLLAGGIHWWRNRHKKE